MERAPLLASRGTGEATSRAKASSSSSSAKSTREGHALRALTVLIGAVCGLAWALFAAKFAALSAQDVASGRDNDDNASMGTRKAFARAALGALRRGGY